MCLNVGQVRWTVHGIDDMREIGPAAEKQFPLVSEKVLLPSHKEVGFEVTCLPAT